MPNIERAKLQAEETEQDLFAPVMNAKVPRQIPRELLTEERLSELGAWIDQELNHCAAERSGFLMKLARWKVAYRAPRAMEPKHFPIFNSSNVTVPVIKEAVNTIVAQLVQATLTARPRWVFKDMAKEWEPFIDEMEEYMDISSERDMELSKHVIPWIVEMAKLGTSILEVGYDYDMRKIYKYSADGKKTYPKEVIRKDGPSLQHIPLDRWWVRMKERDHQSSDWCAKEIELSEYELRRMYRQGKLHSVDELITAAGPAQSNIVETSQELIEETSPQGGRDSYKILEIWATYDIDGDGIDEEIKFYYHRETGMFLGEFFPDFDHGMRPFIKIGYFPVEDRYYDEGLCEMLEQFQEAISAISNRRADNASLANLKMIIKKKMVKGLQPGDPLYSGKVITCNDPFRDVREFQMSEIYPSTINEESILQGRGDRLAGTNEGVAGAAMPVSRTTASAQLALLQEQAKRIDLTVRSIRSGLNEIGFLTLHLYFQYGVEGKALAWLGERGRVVQGVFNLPRALTALGLGIKAQTPTSLQNRQVKRENKIALLNLLTQIHQQLIPFIQAFAPNELPVLAQQMVVAARKYMQDVLETFEETDPDAVLAGLAAMERILPQPENLGGLESFEGRVRGAEALDAISRLEGLLGEAYESANGSPRRSDGSRERDRVYAPEGVLDGDIPGIGISDPFNPYE